MIVLRPFAIGDLATLLPEGQSVHEDAQRYMGDHGLAWTGCEPDGTIAGAGGVLPVTPTRGTTWMIALRPLAFGEWVRVCAKTRAVLMLAHKMGLHRIEADVVTSDACAVAFAKWLGFEIEGDRPLFFPDGSNALLMARFG